MRIGLSTFSLALALAGCSGMDEGDPTSWPSLQLQGKTLALVDDATVETYSFTEQGLVAATIGTRGGPLAGPLYYWKVVDNKLVISEMPDQPALDEFVDPKVLGGVVTATRKTGARVQYRLAKTNG